MSDPVLQAFPVGGLDESNDEVFGPPTAMRVCDNVVFPDGASAVKRQGLLPYTATLDYAQRLVAHDDQVLVVDGHDAYSLYGAPGAGAFEARGPISPCMVSRALFAGANLPGDSNDANFPVVPRGSLGHDGATGYTVRAWCNGLAVSAQVYDELRGAFVTPPVSLNDAAGANNDKAIDNPRVCIVGSVAFVLFSDQNATTKIQYCAIDLTNIAAGWTAQAPLVNSVWDGGSFWDAETIASSSLVALLTCVDTNGSVNLATYTASGTTLTAASNVLVATGLPANGFYCCAIRGNATDGIVLIYSYNSTALQSLTRMAAYTTGLTQTQAPITVFSSIWTTSAGANEVQAPFAVAIERVPGQGTGGSALWMATLTSIFQVGRSYGGGVTVDKLVYATYWTTFTQVSSGAKPLQGPMLNYQMVSKPRAMTVAGVPRIYTVVEFAVQARQPHGQIIESAVSGAFGFGIADGNQTLFLVELSYDPTLLGATWTPCATSQVQSAGDLPPATLDLIVVGSTLLGVGTEVDQSKKTSLCELTYDFAHPGLWQSARVADWTFLAGGMPMIYDGAQLCEVGFLTPAPPPLVKVKATGGGVTNNPQCQYVVVEVQQDAGGNIHRSAPSNPVQVDASSGSGASDIRLVVYPRRSTLRQAMSTTTNDVGPNPIRLQIYRNTATTPQIFYLVAELANDPTVAHDGIDFTDLIADATIASSQQLYTTGGAVESDAPPNLSAIAIHAGRVVGIDETGRTMWFTTSYVRAECPRFSTAFTIDWPEGPLTATWSREQRLHAATADRIWYLLGEGPTDNDVGVDWTIPELWTPDLGVVDARGLALFERGMILATKRGLYVEGLDGSFTWLAKCRRTLAAHPVVTAIVPLQADGVVRICLKDSDTLGANGVILHWDYRHERWATHSLGGGQGFDSAAAPGGTWTGLLVVAAGFAAAGEISIEDPTSQLEGQVAWVTASLGWSWVPVGAAMQGWGEVTTAVVLGRYASPHGVTVTFARNYSAAADPNPRAWGDADVTAIQSAMGGVEQLRADLPTQTCEALAVTVQDAAPTSGAAAGSGAGATFQSLLVRSTPKRGDFHELPKAAVQ